MIDQYTYRVSWAAEDQEYAATCLEFPSLSWLDESPERALAGIRKVVSDCLKDMAASNESAPQPLSAKNYSGRFVVRVPPELHRELSLLAADSGVSLNRLVSHKLAK